MTSFYDYDSGGRCLILRADLDEDHFVLATTEDGCNAPVDGEPAFLGLYRGDLDESVDDHATDAWDREAALAWIGSHWHKPGAWTICPLCSGDGKHSLAIDGQGLTSEDFNDWTSDEFEDYRRGAYDRQCEACNGTGKVRKGHAEREARNIRRRYSLSDIQLMFDGE